jgi:opacity protein-like surface antigen
MKKLIRLLALCASSSAFAGNLYLGTSAGYLVDSEEGYYAAQFGYAFAPTGPVASHVELEVGYTSERESGISGHIVPVMANYRGVVPFGQSPVSAYFGAGLGGSNVRVSGYGWSDNSWGFTYQALAGLQYKASETVSLTLGARYIDIDNVSLFGVNSDVGDDVSIEAGVRFKF